MSEEEYTVENMGYPEHWPDDAKGAHLELFRRWEKAMDIATELYDEICEWNYNNRNDLEEAYRKGIQGCDNADKWLDTHAEFFGRQKSAPGNEQRQEGK